MRINTDKEKLEINFDNDILITDKLRITNNKNIEGKKTYVRTCNLFQFKIKKWYLRNIRHNLTSTYRLIKLYWGVK
ncbi:hypothetical protein SGA02_28250 [Staphylococcus gallinarum]|uniref:Uncharacterized protein n=1 Tax=Staphylococcus gallinarum TaxID=1293 RepID=A0ABQ0Y6J4_STAGA|nr:hypothetical protein SH09_13315 [Staphylococcus gallinarum]GEQ06997.1 hypothetical protein SGA02_28250 [Staphylococcus gallinarum]